MDLDFGNSQVVVVYDLMCSAASSEALLNNPLLW